jgi:hypothetical protein
MNRSEFNALWESKPGVDFDPPACETGLPVNVWNYMLGGYQVLKKWLSYRELSLLDRHLHPEEAEYFSKVVRRIAAIILLGPAPDQSYENILPTATGLASTTPTVQQ